MKKELAAVPQRLRERIIAEGEISLDGAILRFKELNRDGSLDLIAATADFMADWLRGRFGNLNEGFKIAVVDSSGRDLAAFLAYRLRIARTVIKKGIPATMFGEILTEDIHSFTRQQLTQLAVEAGDIKDRKLIAVDDFAASGDTLGAIEKMASRADGKLVAIAVGIAKPHQGSAEIMARVPSLAVVEIESMRAATANEPAKIKFRGCPEQSLVKKWGDS